MWTINIFEGARRIGRVGQLVVIIVCAIYFFKADYLLDLNLVTESPDKEFVPQSYGDRCDYPPDGVESVSRELPNGLHVRVNLCFKSSEFTSPDGSSVRRLVPFRVGKDGRVWGAFVWDESAREYMHQRAIAFRLSEPNEALAVSKLNSLRLQKLGEAGWKGLVGFSGISLVMATVGWIVRGFLGIPRGQDQRPS